MKKLIAIMMCLIMMLTYVSCSSSLPEKEVRGELISNEESLKEGEVENQDEAFSLGKTEGLIYENKFIGIGCTLESNWHFYSDNEIKELNNIKAEIAGEEYEEIMQEAALIYDMFAISDNQLDNINVNLEKMNKSALDSLVIEDALKESIPTIQDVFSNMGYTDLQAELDMINIEGKNINCLYMSGKINDLKMYQKIFQIKCIGYLATITITTYEENTVDSIVEKFYFVK